MSRTGSRRALLGVLLGTALSLALLALTLRWAGWRPLFEALSSVDARYLLLGVAIFLLSMGARAACWRILIGRPVSLWRVLAALNEGYLLNNVLPWRMGELGRALLLGKQPGLSTPGVLSSILVERMYDIVLAVALLVSLLPWAAGASWAPRAALAGAAVVLLGAVILWLLLRRPQVVERILPRLPGGLAGWQSRWLAFRDGLTALERPRSLATSFAWMLASWLLAAVEYWAVIRSVLPGASLLWAGFMLTITLLGVAIPSSPGYLGVFEAAGAAALATFGVPAGQALAAALILHGMVYVIASTLGAVALAADGATLVGLYREVRGWLARSSPGRVG
jgi:uncharacterized protein (TIRG00374 family)